MRTPVRQSPKRKREEEALLRSQEKERREAEEKSRSEEEQSCSGSHPDHYHLLPDNSGSNISGSVATVEYLGTWYSECFK